MGTLRLVGAASTEERHEGEVFTCAYSPDGAFVLTGGWDGHLRLWEATSGAPLVALRASPKPLSACAISPDGKRWLSGSMEGLLTVWDAVSHQTVTSFLAHTRPVSAITYAPDGGLIATASWDRTVALRRVGKEREPRLLNGHRDIVAGCRLSGDGKQLLSWSHDKTLRLWDAVQAREIHAFSGHDDRVTSAALSPDGQWILSGGRDETARLWDLGNQSEAATVAVGVEVCACFFLLDGEAAVVVDVAGRIFLMSVPGFEILDQLETGLKILCAELAPTGVQVALGCEDGRLLLVAVEGREHASLVVTASQSIKPTPGLLGRFLGGGLTRFYQFTCPVCRQTAEAAKLPTGPVRCARCQQTLRVTQGAGRMQNC